MMLGFRFLCPFARILISTILLCLVIVSCSQTTLTPTMQPQIPVKPTNLPATLPMVLPTKKPTAQRESTLSPTNTIPPRRIPTQEPGTINLRITYVTYEFDTYDNLKNSQIWVFYQPYKSPKLLYSSSDNIPNLGSSSAFWSHNGRWLAFEHRAVNENHFAYSVLDTVTQKVTQVTKTFFAVRSYTYFHRGSWSIDDQWLYLENNNGFVDAQIVNIHTKETYSLNPRTQDQLLAWSPVIPDQYAYITRKNFPDPGGDMICIGQMKQSKPLKCIDFKEYTIVGPSAPKINYFSWSRDGEKALVIGSRNVRETMFFSWGSFLFLVDFKNDQWEEIWENEYGPSNYG